MAKKAYDAPAKAGGDEASLLADMRKRHQLASDYDRANRDRAYSDLRFRLGIDQWTSDEANKRKADDRPCLTVNKTAPFVRQVTGDLRQTAPAIKVFGVDDRADKDTASALGEVIRYVENRSDATGHYYAAYDSAVAAGIGHWRVLTEYADDDSDLQDIRITGVDDQIGVLWDPEAVLPTREDAKFCFVPVDYTMDAFKAEFPDASTASFDDAASYASNIGPGSEYWTTADTIRVAEYWVKKPKKTANGRKSYEICRYLVTANEVLEGPNVWPGKFIPIVPCIGDEHRVGKDVIRSGLVWPMRDSQRLYNFFVSAEAEAVAMQPKAPFMVTPDQIKDHLDIWKQANSASLPFLVFTPDPKHPGAPQRVPPPVSSQGFLDAMRIATDDMKAVTGIYDASLGQRSNETSGKAILARQREGDIGTAHYPDNFMRALRYTGRILIDLIPKIYDTFRVLRMIGEDGAENEVRLNEKKLIGGIEVMLNRTDIGRYDVTVSTGATYTTRRQEALDGMTALIQGNPAILPLIGDLVAKAQDWPNADKISERLREMLPPKIKAKEDEEAGENGAPAQPQLQPPEVIAQQAQQEVLGSLEGQAKQADIAVKQAQAEKSAADAVKAKAEAEKAQIEVSALRAGMAQQATAGDPRVDILAEQIARLTQVVEFMMQPPPVPAEPMAEDVMIPAPMEMMGEGIPAQPEM